MRKPAGGSIKSLCDFQRPCGSLRRTASGYGAAALSSRKPKSAVSPGTQRLTADNLKIQLLVGNITCIDVGEYDGEIRIILSAFCSYGASVKLRQLLCDCKAETRATC